MMPSDGKSDPLRRSDSPAGSMVSPHSARKIMHQLQLPTSGGGQQGKTKAEQGLPATTALRVVVMGAAGVGKTTIVGHLNSCRPKSARTAKVVPEISHLEFAENHQTLDLELLDSSGYDSFPAMLELAIRQAQAFVLVCAADSDSSFDSIKELREEILRIKNEQGTRHFPAVVVVNKTDLPQSQSSLNLPYAELAVLCDWGDYGFTKCSAIDQESTQEVLRELLAQVNSLHRRRALAMQILSGKLNRCKSMPSSARASRRKLETVGHLKETGVTSFRSGSTKDMSKSHSRAASPSPTHKFRLFTM